MTTSTCVEANLKADAKSLSAPRAGAHALQAPVAEPNTSRTNRKSGPSALAHRADCLPFRTTPDIVPIAVIPQSLARKPARRNLRRVMTREQGRALEMIGHAADYLNDGYLYEGDENEIINIGGSPTKAIQILVAVRQQILQSLPLEEPKMQRLMHRFWNILFHHTSARTSVHTSAVASGRLSYQARARESRGSAVVPLSSSR